MSMKTVKEMLTHLHTKFKKSSDSAYTALQKAGISPQQKMMLTGKQKAYTEILAHLEAKWPHLLLNENNFITSALGNKAFKEKKEKEAKKALTV